MARVYVDRITVKEFLDHQEKHQKVIVRAREREPAQDKREMTALAEKHGFTLRELLDGRVKGKLVTPKYANPDDPSQTWAGRGRKPLWLVAKMKKRASSSNSSRSEPKNAIAFCSRVDCLRESLRLPLSAYVKGDDTSDTRFKTF